MQWHVVHFVSLILHVMEGSYIKRAVDDSIYRLGGRVSMQCLICVNYPPPCGALIRFRVMPPPPPVRELHDHTQAYHTR
jgi:hypothetical protein